MALGRLTKETLNSSSDPTQNYTDQFTYDLVGNRLQSVHTGPGNGPDETVNNTYNGDDELTKELDVISGVSTETDLKYDLNGSLTTGTTGPNVTTYGYDARNKMASAVVNGATTTYVCDDAGNRVAETTNSGTCQAAATLYLTDDANPTGYAQPIEQKSSAAAAPTVTYIIGDRVLAQADPSGAVSYLLTDGHGSTRALANSAGAVTQTFNYTAFGGALGFNPSATGTIGNTTVFLFGGDAVYDPASGLYMNGDDTRDRLPGAAGFVEADPQGYSNNQDPITLHKYLYGNANAVNGSDPTGHFDWLDGESAEAQVFQIYEGDHPGDTVQDGRHGWFGGLMPDIQNETTQKWLDVKPFTLSGQSNAIETVFKYAPGALFGWLPDLGYEPSDNRIYIGGKPYGIFHAGGIVFYFDFDQNIREVELAMTLLAARMFSNYLQLSLGRAASAGVSTVGADDSAREDSVPAITTLIALL